MDAAEDARPADENETEKPQATRIKRTMKKQRPDHLDENEMEEKEETMQQKPQAAVSSRKRPYEYSEGEMDVAMQKLYKCNYWEDPAYANKLRYFGLQYGREAAFENQIERLHREFEAYMDMAVAGHDAHSS